MRIKVGLKAEMKNVITDDMIKEFSNVSTDKNPLHLDENYAKDTIFGKRIAHGMLSASFISSVVGNELPGKGTIYMKQSLEFKRPVYINDIITTIVEVTEIIEEKHQFILKTQCYNQQGKLVINGDAYVQNDLIFEI